VTVLTDKEWQERYEITSLKGRIWKRGEIAKRAVAMLRSLAPDAAPIVRRTAVLIVLDDPTFMRGRRGTVPARVVEDAAIEAMLRMQREAKP
jgi:HEAT repeat protein